MERDTPAYTRNDTECLLKETEHRSLGREGLGRETWWTPLHSLLSANEGPFNAGVV